MMMPSKDTLMKVREGNLEHTHIKNQSEGNET